MRSPSTLQPKGLWGSAPRDPGCNKPTGALDKRFVSSGSPSNLLLRGTIARIRGLVKLFVKLAFASRAACVRSSLSHRPSP